MKSNKKNYLPHEEVVRPSQGGAETSWLLVVAFLTVLVCALAIFLRNQTHTTKKLGGWQIDAFNQLSGQELGVFNALRIAALEIDDIHKDLDGGWVSVSALEELFIPPFVRDAAWQKQGKMNWRQKILPSMDKHIALYLGNPSDKEASGSFLLVMLHDHKKKQGNATQGPTHAPSEIWWCKDPLKAFPQVVSDQALISSGWREVMAFKGSDEIKRVKGEMIQ